MKEKLKEERGITLIALVITIVVLLILAGVSIAMLTGSNGILTQAKLAKENTALAKEDEENKLANNNEYINEQTGNAVPGKIVTKTKKDNYVDNDGNKATIPAGFTISKIPGEEKVAEGLVIYDIPETDIENVDWMMKNEDGEYNVQTLYNQFVWIPVQSEDEYQREFSYKNNFESNISNTFTDTNYLPTDIQPNIDDSSANENAEKTAVLKYNGFYIARYETGSDGTTIVSKQYTTLYVGKSQGDYKEIAKTMYGESSSYVKSAMCSGIQWDVIMKFVDGKNDGSNNEDNKFDVKISNSNRHLGFLAKTGRNLADKVQNIYDLEGNSVEYVAEKNYLGDPIYRGGYYGAIGMSSSRFSGTGGGGAFRIALYIK